MTATAVAVMNKSNDKPADKPKKIQKVRVAPTAETNRIVREECSRFVADVKAVMARFNCSRNDAVVLCAAAEHNLTPPTPAKK